MPSSAFVIVISPSDTLTLFTAFIPSSPAEILIVPPVILILPSPSAIVGLSSSILDAFAFIASPVDVMFIVPPDISHSIDALIPSLVDVVPSFVVVPVVNVTVPSAILTVPPSNISPSYAGSSSDFIASPFEFTVILPLSIVTESLPFIPLFAASVTFNVKFFIVTSALQPIALLYVELTLSVPLPFIVKSFLLYTHALTVSSLYVAVDVNEFVVPFLAERSTLPFVAANGAPVVDVTSTPSRFMVTSSDFVGSATAI